MTRIVKTLLLIALSGCASEQRAPEGIFVVVPGAINVRSERGFDRRGTEYDVTDADVPSTVQAIQEKLKNEGWAPLSEQWDNRGQKSSYVEGWSCFGSADRKTIFQWSTDWRDRHGNLVTYDISTSDDVRTVHKPTITVKITYFAADSVEADAVSPAVGEPTFSVAHSCADFLDRSEGRQHGPYK